VLAERAEQGEVGGYIRRMAASGLSCRNPWLALRGPFLFFFAQMGLGNRCLDNGLAT